MPRNDPRLRFPVPGVPGGWDDPWDDPEDSAQLRAQAEAAEHQLVGRALLGMVRPAEITEERRPAKRERCLRRQRSD